MLESAKFDIPKNCKLELLKNSRIQKLEDNYILVAHPYPQLEGETLLFQLNPEDVVEKESETMIYRDYSLRKRNSTTPLPKTMSAVQKKKMMEDDETKTRLQCLEVDIAQPLSSIDWNNLITIITEVSAMGWIQILPVGQKSSSPFQFNCMHLIPSNQIPFDKVPLDSMIKNKTTFSKK